MTDFGTEYSAYCEKFGAPEQIELLLCDLNGILRGKWLPSNQVQKLVDGGVRLPISTYAPNIMGSEPPETGLGIVVGDPDGVIVPIAGTLKPVPWQQRNVAQVLVEMTENGQTSPLSTRQLLENTVSRFRAADLHPVIASEMEFYVFKKRGTSDEPPTPPDRLPDAQNYDMEVLDRFRDVLRDIQDACAVQDLDTDTLIAEFGPGQFEINFPHTSDVLQAADTALLFRRLVRNTVSNHGFEATFMAKPYSSEPGNGMHVHASVLNGEGENIFAAEQGASENLKAAVAGLLSTMRDMQAVFAPHMNSYRRFLPMSFAPSRPDWGFDNRAAAIRLPETKGKGARLEHRISGADVNPYLAIAAILGGIHHGLDTNPVLPLPIDDENATPEPPLSHDWRSAVEVFSNSDFSEQVFGSYYRDIYLAVRLDEINALSAPISTTEYRYYLSRF